MPYIPGLRAGIYFVVLCLSIIILMASLWINAPELLTVLEHSSWGDLKRGFQLLFLFVLATIVRLR
jgi:hypothetical protein